MGKKKKINKLAYEKVQPEIVSLTENLNHLGLDQDQLIILAILIGTDYNPGGIKGIGPKNALKLVKQYRNDFDALFKYAKWDDFFNIGWTEIFYTIKKMPVTDEFSISFNHIDIGAIQKLLIDGHDFSEERVNSTLEKLSKTIKEKRQKGLGDFF